MSGPFQVGDVVECIDDSGCPITNVRCPYRKGAIYRVDRAKAVNDVFGRPEFAIGCDGLAGWNAIKFRHLPRATEEFTAQIHACRPIKVEQDA